MDIPQRHPVTFMVVAEPAEKGRARLSRSLQVGRKVEGNLLPAVVHTELFVRLGDILQFPRHFACNFEFS